MALKSDCFQLIKNALEAINPGKLVRRKLKLIDTNTLLVNDESVYKLNENVYIAAFGKAVYGMCKEVENIVDKHLVKGIAILPIGMKYKINCENNSKITYLFGAHNNLPDEDSYQSSKQLESMCASLTSKDLLITLISGGGSALLSLPNDDVTLNDKISTVKLVSSAGASINELNTVRICLSKLKGGGLAKCAYPARVLSLVISDVIHDPIDIIASGPTNVNDLNEFRIESKFKDSLNIIKKYGLEHQVPENILVYLEKKIKNNELNNNEELIKKIEANTENIIIGSNRFATQAIQEDAINLGYIPTITLTNCLEGEAKQCGKIFAYLGFILSNINYYEENLELFNNSMRCDFDLQTLEILNNFLASCKVIFQQNYKKFCILSGGETTVNLFDENAQCLPHNSLGGRNQELTLAFKKTFIELLISVQAISGKSYSPKSKILFTSFGTDGIDGPTDAAGAIVTSPFDTKDRDDFNLVIQCLKEHNSYKYFSTCDGLIRSGFTGTNVSDLQIMLIDNQ